VIFIPKYVSRVVFKDSILGGKRQFWGNPYLNGTTLLFDISYFRIERMETVCMIALLEYLIVRNNPDIFGRSQNLWFYASSVVFFLQLKFCIHYLLIGTGKTKS